MYEGEVEYDLKERVAILEERTQPKKKFLLERLRDYGGIFALLVAIGYSWPLGVWDRFVTTPEQMKEARITELRDFLAESAANLAEGARSLAAITDPNLYDIVGRSYNNIMLLLMSKHKKSFIKESDSFSPEELIVIGLNFQYIYDIETSVHFFNLALENAPQKSLASIEAGRQLAKSYFVPSEFQNIEKGRKYYGDTLQTFAGSRDLRLIGQEITLRSEWGFFEMTAGDWKCGEAEMDTALSLIKTWQHSLNDQGNMMRLIQMNRAALVQRQGQPNHGCQ